MFLVEEKDEADIEDDMLFAEGKVEYKPTVIDLDSTESERTVIVNREGNTVDV